MKCPNRNCQADNQEGAKYCRLCGAKLEHLQKCPFLGCGANDIPEIAKYCPRCGRPLANKGDVIALLNKGIMLMQDLRRSEQWRNIIQHYQSNEVLANRFEAEVLSQLSSLEPISQVETPQTVSRILDMVLVEGGSFAMGDNAGGGDEKPVHTVNLSSFYICRYLITQELWQKIMGNNPSSVNGKNLPVDNISWMDCISFCNKLSVKEGYQECYLIDGNNVTVLTNRSGFRLPTEAEWEYAARGGKKNSGFNYSGSNLLKSVGWYNDSGIKKFLPQYHPVGLLKPNELGLYDMSGNVCEWCWDWYGTYSSTANVNPLGPESGRSRVYRGGRWSDNATNCRVAYRNCAAPSGRRDYFGIGLRLVYAAK